MCRVSTQITIRMGLYRPVHVKTLRSQKLRMLLTHRKLLQSKAPRHREQSARYFAQLRPQGRNGWQGEVRGPHSRSLSRISPTWRYWWSPLLIVRRALREQIVILHRRLLTIER
jgi:transposase